MITGKDILNHRHVRKLCTMLGIDIDPIAQPEEFIKATLQADPRYDGEHPLLRFELENDERKWPRKTILQIYYTAAMMRMCDSGIVTILETPIEGNFDAIIVLGGARQSNLDRARYAAEAIASGKATAKKIIIAGSNRALATAEMIVVTNYAPGAKTEGDLCNAAASVVSLEYRDILFEVFIVEEEKAGTPRVLKLLFAKNNFSSVATVTTQIYQLATELDLARVAKQFGITTILSAGNPSDREIIAKRTPATYLSEVLRTLRAAALAYQAGV